MFTFPFAFRSFFRYTTTPYDLRLTSFDTMLHSTRNWLRYCWTDTAASSVFYGSPS
jgi:hypothetical protein